MFYFIWSSIIISLSILFLFVCYKAASLLKREVGMWASILFVFGFISTFITVEKFKGEIYTHLPSKNRVEQATSYVEIPLQKRLFSTLSLTTTYIPPKDSTNYELKTSKLLELGFHPFGLDYQINSVMITPIPNSSQSKYIVYLSESWALGGIRFYVKSLRYEGIVTLK